MEKSENLHDKFNEIITILLRSNYPDVQIEDDGQGNVRNNVFVIPSRAITVKVFNDTFYCQLDPKITRRMSLFNRNTSWYIDHLKFILKLTASTGKTYAYPRIKLQKSMEPVDIMASACYMFACVNYAINFFSMALNEHYNNQLQSLAVQEVKTYEKLSGDLTQVYISYKKKEK
ncbi:hypothetical protein [Mangrovimonas sp. YM274]|uniref:hypothetical protein n=1 Tax=Mangrovimonas sp. YM274 TaxID=3070660 RepID=UPI0027DE173E|nr:hypothetical protein [Mangrovimonas sp. YM274]WMI70073.1 hypothetical protein RBH95_06915 [Mangrovimonas sp. YM274]